MIAEEFNEKYKEYLEEGHYGLDMHEEIVVDFLDDLFTDLVKFPGFQYSQIKWKFGMARFYSTIGRAIQSLIENKLNQLGKEVYGK